MRRAYGFSAITMAFALLVVMNVYLYHHHYQQTHFDCQGNGFMKNGGYTLNSRVSLSFYGNTGQVFIDGEVMDQQGSIALVHRMASFTVKQHDNSFYVTNDSVAELSNNTIDEQTLKLLLPPIFFKTDTSAKLDIYPLSDRAYLVTSEEYMHLYCVK